MTLVETRLTLPCTVTHVTTGTEPDEHGQPVETTTTTDTVCYIEAVVAAGADENPLGSIVTSDWIIYLPADTTIDSTDRVAVDGYGAFEVFGEPWAVWSPHVGATSHVQARLRRST